VIAGFEQFAAAKSGESIARLSWTRRDLAGFAVEAGIEGALNTLDSEVELYSLGSGGQRNRINLPIDSAKVKERRAEAYAKAGRALSPALRVDVGLNLEVSRLTVTGDTAAERSLRYLKPSMAVDWNPGADWRARLSVRRSVAQLNFFDFISVADLSNDRVNAGNAELRPQQTWEVRASVDRPLLGDGRIKLDLGLDRVSMLQDQILTPEGFSAPGNLGTGHRRFAALNFDAPLSGLVVSGLRLKLNGQLQSTRVHDPISGESRGFTGFFPDWQWSAELRRDDGAFSYGAVLQDRARFTFYRANEIDTNWNGGPYGTAFIEWRPARQTAITFEADNILNTGGYRERLIFLPNRSVGEPSFRELRERNRHVSFALSVKQTFGSGGRPKVAQAAHGLDIVNDGEFGKSSWAA
jgi:outer membrane receptor protein involved in Fe transport